MDCDDILVVIAYPNESTAQAAREWLSLLSAEDRITLELTASLTKDAAGKIDIHQPHGHKRIRRLFGNQSETLKIDEAMLQESAQTLAPGAAALYLLVRDVTPEEVIPALSKYGGAVIKTSLPADREALLKEAFNEQFTAEQVSAALDR